MPGPLLAPGAFGVPSPASAGLPQLAMPPGAPAPQVLPAGAGGEPAAPAGLIAAAVAGPLLPMAGPLMLPPAWGGHLAPPANGLLPPLPAVPGLGGYPLQQLPL